MQIDRSRFLLLTASLAASACNQQGSASPDTGGVDPVASSGDTRGGASTNSTTASEGNTGSDPAVWLEIEPGTEDPSQRPLGKADCDNSVGNPGTCSLRAPGPNCESFNETQRLCQAFPTVMLARPAEAAVACMNTASKDERICDWNIWQECIDAGIQSACVEPATRSECESISSMCGGSLDVFKCQQALSSVRPNDLPRVQSCVREFCEFTYCITDLAQIF